MLRFGGKWVFTIAATLTAVVENKLFISILIRFRKTRIALMLTAEVQTTSVAATWFLITANIGESTVDLFVAFGMIAKSHDAVPDITFPVVVVSDCPSHICLLFGIYPKKLLLTK